MLHCLRYFVQFCLPSRVYSHIEHPYMERRLKLEQWSRVHHVSIASRECSLEQQQALDRIASGLEVADANVMLASARMLYISDLDRRKPWLDMHLRRAEGNQALAYFTID